MSVIKKHTNVWNHQNLEGKCGEHDGHKILYGDTVGSTITTLISIPSPHTSVNLSHVSI